VPLSPPPMCSTPRCPNRATKGAKCSVHFVARRREVDQNRPSGGRRGYTKRWAAFRAEYLERHPRCVSDACSALPEWQQPVATDIDHIDGCGRTGDRAYDETNLQALCHSCHSRKTALHDGGFGHKVSRRVSDE
jgi:5-methylcytosine-specific restriction protein A